LKGIITTTENVTIKFWEVLESRLKEENICELHRIRLYETPRNFIDYYGEK
jgi:6-pyruvoyltetrahydropterin/6-carboxytetrahydropterin synthase